MGNSENKEIYEELQPNVKQIIEMYLTARQFKNAILEEEIITIPSKAFNNQEGILHGGGIKIRVQGEKTTFKAFPFVVNKSFACEVYLKLLLLIENEQCNVRRMKHSLWGLYDATSESFKRNFKEAFRKKYGEKADGKFLEKQIENIANVFKEWRYIYEKYGEQKCVNYGFLNEFCEYLDRCAQQTILEKFEYDVNRNIR